MAERKRQAKNQTMLIRPPPRQPKQTWLWLAPYAAIGIFALAMLIVTALLQWREHDTALSALEGDMHWAERTIETRLHGHQDFLNELGREQEFRQLTYEAFQVKASRYVRDNPEIAAIVWVDTAGKLEWVAPNESTAAFVGEQLTGARLLALQEALRTRRAVFSPDYPGADQRRAHDLILPVQQGSADLGAFIAMQSLETLLRVTLPATFTARYSLTVVDADNRELLSNSSIKPTDRQIAGAISLDLPNNRLELNIVAYRGGGAWLPYLPAALIVVLTLIATAAFPVAPPRPTPRRYRGTTTRRLCLPPGDVEFAGYRPARHRSRRAHYLRQRRLLPHDRLRRIGAGRHRPALPLLATGGIRAAPEQYRHGTGRPRTL